MDKPLDAYMAEVQWEKCPQPTGTEREFPHATHSGIMRIGDVPLRVYRLSNGQCVIDADDFHKLFDFEVNTGGR